VNEIAPGLLSLSGRRLRNRLNLLHRCATLLASCTLELFDFGLRSIRGLLRRLLQTAASWCSGVVGDREILSSFMFFDFSFGYDLYGLVQG
jgi:hypothetical protein